MTTHESLLAPGEVWTPDESSHIPVEIQRLWHSQECVACVRVAHAFE